MLFTVADGSVTAVSVTVTVSFIHFILNRQIKFGRDSCSRSSKFVTGAVQIPLSLFRNCRIRKGFWLQGALWFSFLNFILNCGSAMSPTKRMMEGGVSLSFSCFSGRGGMFCYRCGNTCPDQVPLCCGVHSENPSCLGSQEKANIQTWGEI